MPVKSKRLEINVARLAHAEGLPLPAYQTAGAAGLDLVAAVPAGKSVRLAPMARALVPTGLVLELPEGIEGQVRPRSGLALRHGVTVLNSPGTIDCDYRGELQVLLVNLGDKAVVIERGERIAQLVVVPVNRVALVVTVKLDDSERGAGGFGSTGTSTVGRSSKRLAAMQAPEIAAGIATRAAAKKTKLFQARRPQAKVRTRRAP